MIENTEKHRRRLARMVVRSMDMESLVLFAQTALEVDYEENDDAYFQYDAESYDLKGIGAGEKT